MMSTRRFITGLLLILAALAVTAPAGAAPPDYTFDKDPIRLGMKAIEEDRDAEAEARFNEAIAAGYQIAKAKFGLAVIAARAGRLKDAETLYREALTGEDSPEARASLGLVLLSTGRDAEAAAEFDRALTAKPKLWPALYGRARLLMKENRWDEAKALLDQGKGLKGRADGLDLLHFGTALYERSQGRLDQAETAALLAAALNPADPEVATLVATIYEEKGVPALAIDAWERALATPGRDPSAEALTRLGGLYQGAKRYNDARDAYVKALGADSTYVPAYRDLARLYTIANQEDKAIRVYQKWLTIVPDDRDALLGLSETALAARQNALALDAAGKAMAADSSSIAVRRVWARASLRSPDSAVKARAAAFYLALPDSLRTPAEDAEAWFQKGMLDLTASRTDAAIASLTEAARLDSTSALYPLNLGIAFLRARRASEAIPLFRRTLSLSAEITQARVFLAQALTLTDSLAAAESEYRIVLETEPANAMALRGLAFCAIRKADYSEAVRAYKGATEADPGNVDGWAGLGNAYLGLGNLDAAEAAFKRARSIDPENSTLKKGMELLNNARKGSG